MTLISPSTKVFLGSTPIKSIHLGRTLIWSQVEPWFDNWPTPWENPTMNSIIDGWKIYSNNLNWASSVSRLPLPPKKVYVEGVVQIVANGQDDSGFGITGNPTPISNVRAGTTAGDDTVATYFSISRSVDGRVLKYWHGGIEHIVADSTSVRTGENIVGMAIDVKNKSVWLRVNDGAWLGGGNPSFGAFPTATLTGSQLYVISSTRSDTNRVELMSSETYQAPFGFETVWTTVIGPPGGGNPPVDMF